MTLVLTIWTLVSSVIGLVHGSYIYRRVLAESSIEVAEHPVAVRVQACYVALWTFGLWFLFGALVTVLWVISVVAYGIAKPFGWRM